METDRVNVSGLYSAVDCAWRMVDWSGGGSLPAGSCWPTVASISGAFTGLCALGLVHWLLERGGEATKFRLGKTDFLLKAVQRAC